jgi:hypothetical protein
VKPAPCTTPTPEAGTDATCPKCGCEFPVVIPPLVAAARLNQARRRARAHFNKMLHQHLDFEALQGNTLVPSWANRFGVSDEYVYAQGRTTQITSVLAAGDLDALDPEDLVPLLERWLDRTRARVAPVRPSKKRDVTGVVLTHMTNAGDLADEVRTAMSHGSEGNEEIRGKEWRNIEAKLARIEEHAHIAKLGVRAAAEAEERGAEE